MSSFKVCYNLLEQVNDNVDTSPYYLKKPNIIAVLETNKDSIVESFDSKRIRYFKLPKAENYPLNLEAGFKNYQFRSDGYFKKGHFEDILTFLINQYDNCNELNKENTEEVDAGGVRENEKYDIISHRGAFSRILLTPIDQIQEWTIFAAFYNNKLYLNFNDTKNFAEYFTPQDSYHFKFAQYCFTDDPSQDPDTSAPIREGEQIYCMYRSQLRNFNLLYLAEIDGIISDKKLPNVQNPKELNQCRFVHTKLMWKNNRTWRNNYRIKSWWAKSYLSGVNDIYVGLKTDSGFVYDHVEHVILHELVREQQWSPKECLSFLYKILTKIIEEVKECNCPYTTYELHYNPSRKWIELKKHGGKTDKTLLTEEYIEHITKN